MVNKPRGNQRKIQLPKLYYDLCAKANMKVTFTDLVRCREMSEVF